MKTLYLILISCYFCIAQNPELFTNNWYLEKIVENNEEYIFPSFDPNPITITFDDDQNFMIQHRYFCNTSTNYGNITDTQLIVFVNILDGIQFCENTDEGILIYQKVQQLIGPSLEGNEFSYSITNVNNYKKLIIINQNTNNSAIYNSINLSTSSPLFAKKVTLSPNPVSSILTLENATAFSKGYVFSIEGKLIQEVVFTNNAIDVSSFSKGIYLLKLKDASGGIVVEKFVKE